MALRLLVSGNNPICFDGYHDWSTLKGGEVLFLTQIPVTNADTAVADAKDGYTNTSGVQNRPVVTATWAAGRTVIGLADDGIANYGTLIGTVVGGTAGQDVTGTVIGPHSSYGSQKVTVWDKPGLYGVTLDAVDTTASTGLVPTNTTLKSGDPLYCTIAGLITPNSAVGFDTGTTVIGTFVSFETNGSKVTTSSNMVNTSTTKSFYMAVIHWRGAQW